MERADCERGTESLREWIVRKTPHHARSVAGPDLFRELMLAVLRRELNG